MAGKALLIRNTLAIIVFGIFDIITKNIYISFSAMLLTNIFVIFIYDFRLTKMKKEDLTLRYENVKKIVKDCMPLGISTLVSMYVINAVKYAIDMYGDNTMQTYFNVLYMPTFVINLVSIFIMKPFLKPFGEYWNQGEYKKFIKTIVLIILFLTGFTAVIEVAALTLGIPILGWLYGIDLQAHRLELFLLILSGLFYAASTVIFYALGTIRRQKNTTIAYVISAVFAFFISNILVKTQGILGATMASTSIMVVLFFILFIFFGMGYQKEKKLKEEGNQ